MSKKQHNKDAESAHNKDAGSAHNKDAESASLYSNKLENVSRETISKLQKYHHLLIKWQASVNLVSNSTLDDAWNRHFVDSCQLYDLIDNKQAKIADLGSGAGFPGVVLAIMGAEDVTLIESDQKKCIFMREVLRETATKSIVLCSRIESAKIEPVDIITARALASLDKLLSYSKPLLKDGGYCLFLKGENLEKEITDAEKIYNFSYNIIKSKSDNSGKIIKISNLEEK